MLPGEGCVGVAAAEIAAPDERGEERPSCLESFFLKVLADNGSATQPGAEAVLPMLPPAVGTPRTAAPAHLPGLELLVGLPHRTGALKPPAEIVQRPLGPVAKPYLPLPGGIVTAGGETHEGLRLADGDPAR
jgi:hypothetical protein